MEIKFADSFFKSLNKLRRRETWWYKTYEFFRYDIKRFFRNIWKFRKELYEYHDWDWCFQIDLFKKGLEGNADYMEKYGHEIEEPRFKKIKMMRRAIELMDMHRNDTFLELAEKELGLEYKSDIFNKVKNTEEEESNNKKIRDLSLKIEKETWNELFEILKGQDYSTFSPTIDFHQQFDGSGLKSWWD